MTYRDSLSPWAIVRLLPNNLQWIIIARYRNRSDADGHLQLLRRRVPQMRFEVIWDLPGEAGFAKRPLKSCPYPLTRQGFKPLSNSESRLKTTDS